jgi:hypothetical protein
MVIEPGGNGLVIPVTIRVTIFPIFPELTILVLQQLLQEKTKISHRWYGDEMERRIGQLTGGGCLPAESRGGQRGAGGGKEMTVTATEGGYQR